MPISSRSAPSTSSSAAANCSPGKVALISGGGSGHEPLHAGFVGRGMLDAACPGQVFTSPTPDQMVAALEAVETGGGCLFIVKNYEGDVMNFQMAADLAGKDVATVVTDDDVAVEKSTWSTGRRGVAGTLIVERIVGAAAEQGVSLAQLKALGDSVNRQTRSMGVALTSCTVPAAGSPTFSLGEDEMEFGVGIHGEPGRRRVKLTSADTIADEMVGAIVKDLAPSPGAEALLLVNGFGGTPAMELYLMVNSALRVLRGKGVRVSRVSHRQLRNVARDGRLLDHGQPARRRAAEPMGRARAHGCAALGDLTSSKKIRKADCPADNINAEAPRQPSLFERGTERPLPRASKIVLIEPPAIHRDNWRLQSRPARNCGGCSVP